jgi:hypothetical protein
VLPVYASVLSSELLFALAIADVGEAGAFYVLALIFVGGGDLPMLDVGVDLLQVKVHFVKNSLVVLLHLIPLNLN